MIKWAVYLIYWARKSVFSVCKRRKVHRASTEPQLNEAYSGGREKTNIQHFFSSLPGWTCSVSVSQRCLYHLCARSEDIQFFGAGHHIHPSQGFRLSLLHINHQKFCRPSLIFFWQRIELVKGKDMA